ncbi:toprim domain-containing protein [Methylocucumis oryzae]|uniref:toprim domain-containing protein n=1 Tax=Methylocucumis oryzae TaxID=1632867 RepID=UPI000696FD1F|nr:toprim domain-containing protein [Methylocucumis oryzae]
MTNLSEFLGTIRLYGLNPPTKLTPGKIQAFPGLGKKNGNTAARCMLFIDLKGGWFMDYSTGLFEVWQAKCETPYTDQERQAFKEKCERDRLAREQEIIKGYQQTAYKAASIWKGAPLADDRNVYCIRKKIQPHGAKQAYFGSLIIPIYDQSLRLVNLQFIQPDGAKRFLTGGRKKDCFWWLGKKTDTVLIAEGFATAASLHESTGLQTFVAFDAGNIVNVAKIFRAKNPEAEIIICGDNDASGTGQKAAKKAAIECQGKYLIPSIKGFDWNDVARTARSAQ